METATNKVRKFAPRRSEAGVALLIAMFAVLLVSLAAISLILSAGTETALAGNYRSSASAYYAASAGLEEARGRLLSKNPDFFNNTIANFIPTTGAPLLAVGQVRYITNPIAAENVLTVYPDTQYDKEFGAGSLAAASGAGNVQTIPSVSTVTSGGTTYQGPLFKWVRINPATEQSIGVDVDADGNPNNNTIPLYYDPAHLDAGGNPSPSLIVSAAPPATAVQVFELTALAVLPNGSQKLLQYVVAPVTLNLQLPSALTLNTNNAAMNGGSSSGYQINGQDQCNAAALPLPAIGYDGGGSTNYNNIKSGLLPYSNHYIGATPPWPAPPTPSVINVAGSLSPSLQTPTSLDQLVQLITQNADAVLTPASGTHADPGDLPAGMSPTHPMTVVVDGDYSQSGSFTGYGLLVVTGDFSFSASSGWRGMVLVIGQGTATGSGFGGNEFDGAILVAKTQDTLGNELASLGQATFDITGSGGSGINYNSCWINSAQPVLSYKALSYREIGQ
ncbi:MAG: hypothetical protein ACHQLQ_15270 [Candidatus Acidiferrales bacterium]